ncbi:MAG: polysaccharide lyase 8 family protein [Draconibacterium sp.]|nr:polysaccharide lyase 8 family protein [Draconibacterium sp.]
MKLKNLINLTLILLLFSCTQPKTSKVFEQTKNYPEELQLLHQNVLTNILDEPADLQYVKELLDEMQDDGTWGDIDYTSKERGGWTPRNHLSNLLEISKAYQTSGTEFYQQKNISKKMHLALNFWLENDLICPNWWYPEIGVPMVLAPVMILMEAELSPEQIEKGVKILNRSKIGMTGQNKVWQSGNVLLRNLLLKNVDTIRIASESIKEELVVSTGEGVQPDWSYHQHGPQLQFGNYGLAYVGDMIKWITILRNTPFQFNESKVEILRNYLLEGQQWVTWKNFYDISSCGRQLFPKAQETKAASLAQSMTKMEKLDPEFASDYEKANQWQNLSGNRHFWRSDVQIQRTPEYYFSLKMCSERVIGAESCNSENIQGYYMGDGATFLYQTQNEYLDIFPFWDWKKIPGTTVQQDNDTLPVLTARGYRIESDFVGGVSDGQNGIAVMDYNRDGLKARKSWFMFNNKVICLGAGVSASEGLPVTTSVNQSFLNGEVVVKTAGGEKIVNESEEVKNPQWILHDNIGYFFPKGGSLQLQSGQVNGAWNWVASRYPEEILKANIFKLYFEHGKNPKNDSYEYILVPNATRSVLEEMEKQLSFEIINTINTQEVVTSDKTMAGVVFYKAGKSAAFGGFEVDQPCLVMLKKQDNGIQISVADPTQKLAEINLVLQREYSGENLNVTDGKTHLKIELPKEGEGQWFYQKEI